MPSSAGFGCGTNKFLDSSDFEGSYDPPHGNSLFGAQSLFNGRVVFNNLPRTVVESVLPRNLRLAVNTNPDFPSLHPVVLIYGHQTDSEWILPWGEQEVGQDYREMGLVIPFVQRTNGSKWHNYVVRMYLDDKPAELLGNWYYGYFKQIAEFKEVDTVAVSSLEVDVESLTVFKWAATATSAAFFPHNTAATTLENYRDAIEIMSMPLLGTFADLGGRYVCSYWEWDMQGATARPIDVTLEFLRPFRDEGMEDWVRQGTIESVEKGAFEIQGIQWKLAYPPKACRF